MFIHILNEILQFQVAIQGKLSDYGNLLYIFVEKINLRSTDDYVEYLQRTWKWYQKYFL